MAYTVELTPHAERQLAKLQKQIRLRIEESLLDLREDPRPDGVKKLKGTKDLYRIRVSEFRIIYQIIDTKLLVTVVKIADRKDSYR